jgi:hypothetical protein
MAVTYTLDFETYWDRLFTLKKMTPPEYILSDQFAVHGMAVSRDGAPAVWLYPKQTSAFFEALKAQQHDNQVTVITYNALFDMCICAWRYGYVPQRMVDVLGMARCLLKSLDRYDLGTVSRYLRLGVKGKEVLETCGLTTDQLMADKELMGRFEGYACKDADLTNAIYRKLHPQFPGPEFTVMDLVLRAAVIPQFRYSTKVLTTHLAQERKKKAEMLARCGASKADLMSAEKFSALLEAAGVAVERKPSPADPEKTIPALSKTDTFLQSLLDSPDDTVRYLAEARLGHKSTLEETRTQRFLNIAKVTKFAPVPLKYGNTQTHRLAGDWKLNMQNMPRGGTLRRAFVAPAGSVVIAADMAQIEARLVAWVAGCDKLTTQFAEDLDPYSRLGEKIFNLEHMSVNKHTNPTIRFIGKQGILGLGYGAASNPSPQYSEGKFHWMVHTQAKLQLGHDIEFSGDDARAAVTTYRNDFPEIPRLWQRVGDKLVPQLLYGHQEPEDKKIGPFTFKLGRVIGPGGLELKYPKIRKEKVESAVKGEPPREKYFYGENGMRYSIYGAKLVENLIQFLARVHIMDAAVSLYEKHGLRFALQAHDELVFVVEEKEAERARSIIREEMSMLPSWADDKLPLEVEVSKPARSYGEAK